ncbi:MAG: hypothetical protein LJE74_03395 [Proteobacteria bacterium]|jgi:hypothetical protein|nr:hypothetical protein [Pseudomonadota bacterium]MCG6935273.1 hypothetical protein [Pseudomonadota bacterium]
MSTDYLEIDLPELAESMTAVCELIREPARNTQRASSQLADPDQLCDGLSHFTQIIQHLDQHPDQLQEILAANRENFSDLTAYGLQLLDQLGHWCDYLNNTEAREALDEIIVTLAVWFARYIGPLRQIEPIVEALSKVANLHQDPEFLGELSQVYREIADAVAPEIKQDLDRSNPGRPWRILNLNYGIVATRSHQPEIMEQAFEQLRLRLAEDAPEFFTEGMAQMDAISYPEHVRRIMEKYYALTNNPTLH